MAENKGDQGEYHDAIENKCAGDMGWAQKPISCSILAKTALSLKRLEQRMNASPAIVNRCLTACLITILLTSGGYSQTAAPKDRGHIDRIWKSGETLPAALAAQFPIPPLKVPNDTGINVLVDLAHQCAFATLWGLPRNLHRQGFRSCVSHASLDTVVVPGKLSRVRIPVGQAEDGKLLRPFGWVPNPRFNVVISFQSNPEAQSYLPEERAALVDFVTRGGGLIVILMVSLFLGVRQGLVVSVSKAIRSADSRRSSQVSSVA